MHAHPHKHMLKTITNLLLARTGNTILQKVRAHIGIIGNERADRAAASHPAPQANEQHDLDAPHTLRTARGKNWIHLPTTTAEGTQWRPAANLHTSTQRHLHDTVQLQEIMRAKAKSEYLRNLMGQDTVLEAATHPTRVDRPALATMAKTTTITPRNRHVAMQIRTGNLHT